MRTTSKKHRPKAIFFAPPEEPINNIVYLKIKLAHVIFQILILMQI